MPTMPADPATSLALERTRLAHERTLMAWVRTAMSLISFGFTIYKAFEYLRASQAAAGRSGSLSPRGFGLAMIGIAIGSLTLATIDHRRELRALEAQYGPLPRSTAGAVALAVVGLGIVALLLIVLNQ